MFRKWSGEFRDFLLRGNLVEVAVGIVIGLAFAALVTALVADLITPIIAAIGGKPDFANLDFTINKSRFLYGDFINQLITFVTIALVIFLFVVKPVNALMNRYRPPAPDMPTRDCPECLSVVPAAARRCPHCTAEISPAAPASTA